ncbi:hypothetical protein A2U01_0042642, partial [Trifolium medium]|nr:hypothetical protein [Trifolium medium]
MSKSTKSTKGSSAPDKVLFSKITQAEPISTIPAQESRRVRTKSVAVKPKKVPKVSNTSSPSTSVKESSGRRLESTAGRSKGIPKANFDFVENPVESNIEFPVDTTA